MPPNGEKLNRIEELKTKLSSKNYKAGMEHRDHFTHPDRRVVPDSWGEDGGGVQVMEKVFMKTSLFKKFFIFSAVFFLLAMGYAAYTFFIGGNMISNDNIEISVLGNTFTSGGELLPLTVGIINKNNSPLELADLVLEYPKGVAEGMSQETERLRESLGTIPAGGIRNENIELILFGEQGVIIPVKITLEYRVQGSNAIFIKDKFYNVSIDATPINLSLEAPSSITANQDINLNIKATLNSTRPTGGVIVRAEYPVGFQFVSSEPKPSIDNNVWNLGDLAPGTERDISILGKMVDVLSGEEKTFRIYTGLPADRDKSQVGVIFNSLSHTVAVTRPFIEAQLFVNGQYQSAYTIDSKGKINGEIRWANNSDSLINNLEIRAKISGNAVNKKTINAFYGFYNSLRDEIVWSSTANSDFREVDPGDSGSVSFSLSPASLYSVDGLLVDPSIKVDISVSGEQSVSGFEEDELTNSESKVIRIISDLGFSNKALYYSGVFKNTGPIPPKVGQKTTYTVVWSVANTANNISKARVVSSLPPWIEFAGQTSPAAEDLIYNSATKQITWNIGTVQKGAGITRDDKEVSFQVSFTPSLSQVNTAPILINEAVLTGVDDFAKVEVRVNKGSLTTNLSDDPGFPSKGGAVTE